MKKFLEKFKSKPLPLKLGALTLLFWIIPFIESIIFGYSGWNDLPIHDLILLGLGTLFFAFAFIKLFIIPVGHWIGVGGKWVINKIKGK